jgi:hypothetical protein
VPIVPVAGASLKVLRSDSTRVTVVASGLIVYSDSVFVGTIEANENVTLIVCVSTGVASAGVRKSGRERVHHQSRPESQVGRALACVEGACGRALGRSVVGGHDF